VCKSEGWQVSGNVERTASGITVVDPKNLGSNWSARPYFLDNVVIADRSQHAVLSSTYEDRATHRATKTITYPIGQDVYLFVDIDTNEVDPLHYPE
jgi:hypothetical protein